VFSTIIAKPLQKAKLFFLKQFTNKRRMPPVAFGVPDFSYHAYLLRSHLVYVAKKYAGINAVSQSLQTFFRHGMVLTLRVRCDRAHRDEATTKTVPRHRVAQPQSFQPSHRKGFVRCQLSRVVSLGCERENASRHLGLVHKAGFAARMASQNHPFTFSLRPHPKQTFQCALSL